MSFCIFLLPPEIQCCGKNDTDKVDRQRSRDKIGIRRQNNPDNHGPPERFLFPVDKCPKANKTKNNTGE